MDKIQISEWLEKRVYPKSATFEPTVNMLTDFYNEFVPQWVSVETPPEVGEYVLVCNTEGAILKGRLLNNGWVALFSDGEKFMGELTATHWQPLPPPPTK